MKRQLLANLCLALLILLYTYTAVSKSLDQYRFVFQMKLSPFFLVRDFAAFWGWFIPWVELFFIAGLIWGRFRKIALLGSLILLSIFEIYIIGMLLTGLHLPCACGGVIAFMSWRMHVLFNAFFIAINIITIKLLRSNDAIANVI